MPSDLSPRINEPLLHQLLTDFDNGYSPQQLRYMASMVTVAAHLRNVEPLFLIELVDETNRYTDTLLSVEVACRLRRTIHNAEPERDCALFDKQIAEKVAEIAAFRNKLAKRVEALMECPGEEDTVH